MPFPLESHSDYSALESEVTDDGVSESAERLQDGTRTFRMIRGEPELTSFGLDLYDAIVGK